MSDPVAPWWEHDATTIAVAFFATGAATLEGLKRLFSGHGKAEKAALEAQAHKTEGEARTAEERANKILLDTIESLRAQVEESERRAAARDVAAAEREKQLLSRITELEEKVDELKKQICGAQFSCQLAE